MLFLVFMLFIWILDLRWARARVRSFSVPNFLAFMHWLRLHNDSGALFRFDLLSRILTRRPTRRRKPARGMRAFWWEALGRGERRGCHWEHSEAGLHQVLWLEEAAMRALAGATHRRRNANGMSSTWSSLRFLLSLCICEGWSLFSGDSLTPKKDKRS